MVAVGILFRKLHGYRCPLPVKIAALAVLVAVLVIACAAIQQRDEPPETAAAPVPEPPPEVEPEAEDEPQHEDEPRPEDEPQPHAAVPDLKQALEVEIATWRGFAGGAASITFDDGTWDQYALGAPILEEHGIRGTFFVISHLMNRGVWDDDGTIRRLMSWDEAAELADAGHEIGGHGATHIDLSREAADAEYELVESRRKIEEELPGVTVASMSWPYFRSTREVREIAGEVYLAARGGAAIPDQYRDLHETNPADAAPADLYDVNSIGLRSDDPLEEWREIADEIYADGGWAVVTLHGIDDGSIESSRIGWEPVAPDDLSAILEEFQRRDLWIAPFGEVAAYIRHRERAQVELNALGPSEISLSVTGDERAGILDVPLTLRVSVDNGTGNIPLELVGGPTASRGADGELIVEVVPNGEPVIIRTDGYALP